MWQQLKQNQNPQTTPGHVKPRIEAIEKRMQVRGEQPASPSPNANNSTSTSTSTRSAAASSSSSSNNNVLVVHSPMIIHPTTSTNIKQFESDVLKRQAEYTERVGHLEGRLALFHTRLANECADRGREHALTAEEYVNTPLEEATRRGIKTIDTELVKPVMDPLRASATLRGNGNINNNDSVEDQNQMQTDEGEAEVTHNNNTAIHETKSSGTTDNTTSPQSSSDHTTKQQQQLPNLVTIERHTNLLEAQINHHNHVTLFHTRRSNFDSIDKTCRTTVQPALALEMTKADKRESSLSRRFDSSSGEYTRLISEMTSSRVSSLGYIEQEINNWDISDSNRAEHYLEEIRAMKALVLKEREARVREDEAVVQKIVQTRKMLEEDILLSC